MSDYLKKNKIHWLDCVIIFAITYLGTYLFNFILFKPLLKQYALASNSVPLIFQMTLMLIFSIFFVVKIRKNSLSDALMIKPIAFKTALKSVFYGLGIFVLVALVSLLMNKLIPGGLPKQNVEDIFSMQPRSLAFILSIFMIGLMAPVVEEIFFRGYLFNAFRPVFSLHVNMIVTSLIFGFIHGDPYRAVTLVIGGYLLNRIAWQEKSIVASMITHGTWNSAMVILSFLLTSIK